MAVPLAVATEGVACADEPVKPIGRKWAREESKIERRRFSAESPLRQPRRFLRDALSDLKASVRPARMIALTQLRSKHRRTWFGYAWLLVPALTTAVVCAVLRQSQVIAVGATPMPYPLFAFAGMLLWQGLTEGVTMPVEQIMANRALLTRTPIPHEAVLLAGCYTLILNAGVRLCVLIGLLLGFGVAVKVSWLFLPFGMLLMIAFGTAVGLLLSPLSLLYEDVGRAISVVTGFGLLLTPVLYPLPPQSLLWLSPIAPLLDGVRGWITGAMPRAGFATSATLGLVGLMAGWLLYRLARPHLAERLG